MLSEEEEFTVKQFSEAVRRCQEGGISPDFVAYYALHLGAFVVGRTCDDKDEIARLIKDAIKDGLEASKEARRNAGE